MVGHDQGNVTPRTYVLNMSIPAQTNDNLVAFLPMLKLSLDFIGPGVFSSERLVRFLDSSGEQQTALVDALLVHEQGQWLEVRGQMQDEETALISMPTDGTRVIVRRGLVVEQ